MAIGLFLSPNSAVADDVDQITLEPVSNWHIEYAGDRCKLLRLFGSEEEPHLLLLEQFTPDYNFSLLAAGPIFSEFNEMPTVGIAFGDENMLQFGGYMGETPAFGRGAVNTSVDFLAANNAVGLVDVIRGPAGLPSIDSTVVSDVEQMHFFQHTKRVTYETGEMQPPIEALNACMGNLIESWGLDAEDQRSRQTEPRLKNYDTIAQRITRTMPRAAFRREESGTVQLLVIVEGDGQVSSCAVHQMTEYPDMENAICDLMDRADYTPAFDSEGAPVRSFHAVRIVYRGD